MNEASRPFVSATGYSQPFWNAYDHGELVVQQCAECQHLQHYPQPMCQKCQGTKFNWKALSGKGHIYSFTVARRAFHPYWEGRTPYVLAIIELEEGIRILSDILDTDVEAVAIGQQLEAHFEDQPQGGKLLRFRLL